MDWKLEVVVIPVSDVDRAKQFYSEQLGFNVDVDNRMGESFRNVQLTPRLGVLGHHRHRAHARLAAGRGRYPGRSSRTGCAGR
jgi:catechol 2,3-dioxygenase-like lactoylglutathione lyase family enzyme